MSKWEDMVNDDGEVETPDALDDADDSEAVRSFSTFDSSSLMIPVGNILAKADKGTFFRGPLVAFLMGLAALTVLATFYITYKTISGVSELKESRINAACENLDKAKEALKLYERTHRMIDVSMSPYYAKRVISDCKAAKEAVKRMFIPWLLVLGLFLSGLATAQVLLYRAHRMREVETGRYPVTPIIVELFRASGECTAVTIAILGFFFGFQSFLFSTTVESTLPAVVLMFETTGWQAIFLGPVAGFMTLLLTHYSAEMMVALVAIANNTTPKSDA